LHFGLQLYNDQLERKLVLLRRAVDDYNRARPDPCSALHNSRRILEAQWQIFRVYKLSVHPDFGLIDTLIFQFGVTLTASNIPGDYDIIPKVARLGPICCVFSCHYF
jgi:hypothetical protein